MTKHCKNNNFKIEKLVIYIISIFLSYQAFAQTRQYNIKNEYFIVNKGQWNSEVLYLAKLNGLNAWITKTGVVYDFYKIERNPHLISPDGGEIKNPHLISPDGGEIKNPHLISPDEGEIKNPHLISHDGGEIKNPHLISPDEGEIKNPHLISPDGGEIGNPLTDSTKWGKENLTPHSFSFVSPQLGEIKRGSTFTPSIEDIKRGSTVSPPPGEIKRGSIFTPSIEDIKRGSTVSPPPGEIKRGLGFDSSTIEGHVLKSEIIGIDPSAEHHGINKSEGYYNYFLGNDSTKWASFVPLYKEVRIKSIYKGIDIRYYFDKGKIRYDYIVQPGADISQIKIKYNGQNSLSVNELGELVINTSLGDVIQGKLFAYQNSTYQKADSHRMSCNIQQSEESEIKQITCNFVINSDGTIGFELENYNADLALIIDPMVWATYLGGNNAEGYTNYNGSFFGNFLELDAYNNPVLSGTTTSSNFPTTLGAYHAFLSGIEDSFITKMKSDGSDLIFSTFLGGTRAEYCVGLKVEGGGNIYIAGTTSSYDFPVTPGAFQTTSTDGAEVFISKFSPLGGNLIYSTYIGNRGLDVCYGLTIDKAGNAFITGITASDNFPIAGNAYQKIRHADSSDNFLTELNTAGNTIIFSTFFGSNSSNCIEYPVNIILNSQNEIIVSGITSANNYPVTADAIQSEIGGGIDLFISKFNSEGSSLVYSTYLGNSGDEYLCSADIDDDDNVYFAGTAICNSVSSCFPTTSGAYDMSYNGSSDIFVFKMNSFLNRLLYSTFLGASSDEISGQIKVNGKGEAYITGSTYGGSNSDNYPVVDCTVMYQNAKILQDALLSKLNSDGSDLLFSTKIGGTNSDWGLNLALCNDGKCVISGMTQTQAGEVNNFPVTAGAYDVSFNGYIDYFILKFDISNQPPEIKAIKNINFKTLICETAIDSTFWIKNTGDCDMIINDCSISGDNFTDFNRILPASFPVTIRGHDSVKVKVSYTPTGTGIKTANFNFSNNTSVNPWMITLNGKKDSISYKLNVLTGDTISFGRICKYSRTIDTSITIKNISTIPTTFYKSTLNLPFGFSGKDSLATQFDVNELRRINLRIASTLQPGIFVEPLWIWDTCYNSKEIYLKIQIDPLPDPLIIGPGLVCEKNLYDYKAQPDTGFSNEWQVDGGTIVYSDNGQIDIVWDPVSEGMITLNQTNIETGCSKSNYIHVFIQHLPNADIQGSLSVCRNKVYRYSCEFEPNVESLWIINGGKPDKNTGDQVNVAWTNSDYGTIELIRTNKLTGCRDSANIKIDIISVPHPFITGPVIVCKKGKYTYYSNSGGIISNEWHITGGKPLIASGNQVDINWSESGKARITLVQTNTLTGCTDSSSVDVIIGNTIKPSISGKSTFCAGGSTILTADADYDKYLWSTGDTSKQIRVANSGRIFLYVKDTYGCDGWSDTLNIIEVNPPSPQIIPANSLCDGEPAILRTNMEYMDYRWSTGDTTAEIILTKPGIITVFVIDSNGCSGSSNEFDLKFNPKPLPKITGPELVCLGVNDLYAADGWQDCDIKWIITGGDLVTRDDSDKAGIIWTISGPGRVKLILKNKLTGCQDSSFIDVNIGNVLKPVITGSHVLCSGTTITLSADINYDDYLWSSGEKTKKITVNSPGKYRLMAKNNGVCQGWSDEFEVKEYISPQPIINGTDNLCKGESGQLSVDKEYSNYKWNTNETTRLIQISNPGTYFVDVIDSEGCQGHCEFTVKERKSDIAGLFSVDFGSLSAAKSLKKSLMIENRGNETIKIKNINLQIAQVFSFTTIPVPLTELQPNEQAELDITFSSLKTGIFSDSIVIETEQPCKSTYLANLKGICKGNEGTVKIWLPDTSANAGDKDYCIPLRANYSGEESPLEIGYNAEIRFSSKAMDIKSPPESVVNGENIIELTGNAILNKGENKLNEFCGIVLLSENDKNPLRITKFEWSAPLATDTINGSLKILACQETLPAVRLFTPASIVVSPNPSQGTADISITGDANATLEIYSIQGKLVLKQNLDFGNNKNLVLKIDLLDFGAGVYYAVVKSVVGTAGARMDVVK